MNSLFAKPTRLFTISAAAAVMTATAVHAQDARDDPVIQPDTGWVENITAGPICDFFTMYPSGRTWAVERGKPWAAGILLAAKDNADAWRTYDTLKALGQHPTKPLVVVSASTSPAPPGSNHPPYSSVTINGARSQTACGGTAGAEPLFPSAIAILSATQYQ